MAKMFLMALKTVMSNGMTRFTSGKLFTAIPLVMIVNVIAALQVLNVPSGLLQEAKHFCLLLHKLLPEGLFRF